MTTVRQNAPTTTAPRRFGPKQLVTLGIFLALYGVIHLLCNMLGALGPIFVPIGALLAALINGTTFALLLTRVVRFGTLTLFAGLLGVIFVLLGDYVLDIPIALVVGAIADAIASRGAYRGRWTNVLAYGVFALWPIGSTLPLLFMRDRLIATYRESMGADWADRFSSLMSPAAIVALMAALFVTGCLGGMVGQRILRTHFQPAGVA